MCKKGEMGVDVSGGYKIIGVKWVKKIRGEGEADQPQNITYPPPLARRAIYSPPID
jgi:hypothetical protein